MKPIENPALSSVIDFFTSNENNLKILLNTVVFRKDTIALRLLEWFVTNYTKKNNITYIINRPQKTTIKFKPEIFNVHTSYLRQTNGFTKKHFDPFCRSDEDLIDLEYSDSITGKKTTFQTSLGQLNFFRWAIKNLVIDYVEKNKKIINDDMTKTLSIPRLKGKKTELSKSIYKNFVINIYNN